MKQQQIIDLLMRLGFRKDPQSHLDVYEFSVGNGYISGTSTPKDRIRAVIDETDEELAIYAFEDNMKRIPVSGGCLDWQLKINTSGGFPFELLETILTKAVS